MKVNNIQVTIPVIELSKIELEQEGENDICCYFDCNGKDANGMSLDNLGYYDCYMILDCGSGKIFGLKVV